jgi:hypothetical protein
MKKLHEQNYVKKIRKNANGERADIFSRFFWGGGGDESVLWLSFAQQKCLFSMAVLFKVVQVICILE